MSPLVVVLTCLVIVFAVAIGMATIDLFLGRQSVMSLVRVSGTITDRIAGALKKIRKA